MDVYTPGVERVMTRLFDSLGEKDRRRYAAVEAAKFGKGGLAYISRVLGVDPSTIRHTESTGTGRRSTKATGSSMLSNATLTIASSTTCSPPQHNWRIALGPTSTTCAITAGDSRRPAPAVSGLDE